MINEALMATKNYSGSERMPPDSSCYQASKRACQGGFLSHPEGMALPALRIVETLEWRDHSILHASPYAASGKIHVTALAGHGARP